MCIHAIFTIVEHPCISLQFSQILIPSSGRWHKVVTLALEIIYKHISIGSQVISSFGILVKYLSLLNFKFLIWNLGVMKLLKYQKRTQVNMFRIGGFLKTQKVKAMKKEKIVYFIRSKLSTLYDSLTTKKKVVNRLAIVWEKIFMT